MKKTLAHLPEYKCKELELITDIILEKIPDVRMIVLFGSYARGDWVEDIHTEGHTTHVYESDFDILVATKNKKTAEDANTHDRIEKAIEATKQVKTPLSIIYHSFSYVKMRILEGHYFFSDIKKEGIHLYFKKGKFSLGKTKLLTPEERKKSPKKTSNNGSKALKGFMVCMSLLLENANTKLQLSCFTKPQSAFIPLSHLSLSTIASEHTT